MKILYEDKEQIVIHKPAGLATQTARLGECDLVSEVKNFISKETGISNPYTAVINRLDQPVEGIVLFAKNAKAAAGLTEQLKSGTMKKYYYAVVYGHMDRPDGQLTDYLIKDKRSNLSRGVPESDANGKKAALRYRVKATLGKMQLLEIQLLTGRHHQIRCQLAAHGAVIKGDLKYGAPRSNRDGSISLTARHISFIHPVKKTPLELTAPLPSDWKGVPAAYSDPSAPCTTDRE